MTACCTSLSVSAASSGSSSPRKRPAGYTHDKDAELTAEHSEYDAISKPAAAVRESVPEPSITCYVVMAYRRQRSSYVRLPEETYSSILMSMALNYLRVRMCVDREHD